MEQKNGGQKKELKANKTNDGKYKYKMIGVLPKNGEKELWEKHKGKLTMSDFVREAVNAYINGAEPDPTVLSDSKAIEELKEENKQLFEENEELRSENERLEQELAILRDAYASKPEDWLDKIFAVIPEDDYKKPRDILLDAGLIKEWSSEEEWREAQQRFQDEIREFSVMCEKKRKPFPLEYKEGRGWKQRK